MNHIHDSLSKIKEIALKNKYTKWYCNIIEKALERPQDRKQLKALLGYVELHHIMPKSFGLPDTDAETNKVFLTAREHFLVHLCATKMFESLFKQKMVFAFWQLRAKNEYQESRYTNSRLYNSIKPDRASFVNLYNKENKKWVHLDSTSEIAQLEADGWSREMTSEYKTNSMCSMRGKKHSEETKLKMSIAGKGVPKPYRLGRKLSAETTQKMRETKQKNIIADPEKFKKRCEEMGRRTKEAFANGSMSVKGELNPMYGKVQSEETRAKISKKNSQAWERAKLDPVKLKALKDAHTKSSKKMWQNEDLRNRSHTFNSKAMYRYGMTQQEYYDQKLKPLVHLGLLPRTIVRHKLVDLCAVYIPKYVQTYGTQEDIEKFNDSKKKAAGGNKAYIKFQEDQVSKLLAEA